jgi:hypothetical protein
VPENVSLETLRNCTKEALRLYSVIDRFDPDPAAKVAVWYGSREPNMQKAFKKLRRAYPSLQEHSFEGFGHGEIMSSPGLMARLIDEFLSF